jgi:hypothetical protein
MYLVERNRFSNVAQFVKLSMKTRIRDYFVSSMAYTLRIVVLTLLRQKRVKWREVLSSVGCFGIVSYICCTSIVSLSAVCLLWIMVYAIVCGSMVSTAIKKNYCFICPGFIIIYAKFSYLEGGGVCEFIGIKRLVFTFVPLFLFSIFLEVCN